MNDPFAVKVLSEMRRCRRVYARALANRNDDAAKAMHKHVVKQVAALSCAINKLTGKT